MGIKTYTRCPACEGRGTDQNAPSRQTANGSTMTLLRACPHCDGHGVVNVTEVKNLKATQPYVSDVTL